MSERGVFAVCRGIWSHGAFAKEPFTEREAWMWLISEASWKRRRYRAGDYVVDLERGQLAASIRFMAEAWRWSKSRVDRFLGRLRADRMIFTCSKTGTHTGTGITVVSICKYDEYQRVSLPDGVSHGTDAGQMRDRKEDTKDIKDKEVRVAGASAPRPRATRLEKGWKPNEEDAAYAIDRGFVRAEVIRIAEDFHDYWAAKSGQGATKTDWPLTWKRWVRSEADKQKKSRLKPISEIGFYASFGSPELDAWDAYHRKNKGNNCPRDKRGGWTFPTRWPPDGTLLDVTKLHTARNGR